MEVGVYIVLLAPGHIVVWPEYRRFADMHLNAEQVTSKTLTVDGREYLSALGGWFKR